MTLAVRSDHSKTVSLLNLDRWSTSSRELQRIRIETPDETQIPGSHQCIHPPYHVHHRGKLDFLEEMEDELEDTIMAPTWHQPAGMSTRGSA